MGSFGWLFRWRHGAPFSAAQACSAALTLVVAAVASLGTLAGAGSTTAGAATAPAPAATATTSPHLQAYWLVASDGGVFSFGGAPFYGSMGGQPLNKPIVGIASTTTHKGYWEVASDGGIFSFGAAQFHGSMGGKPLNEPVVGIAADPATGGYWEVASDGGIFSFTAPFFGSMGGRPLNQPVVGMAATATGDGYWLVAADGGVFAFGAAKFYGSTGAMTLNKPIVGMAAMQTGTGYWLVASDGGLFAFGGAADRFYGSLGGQSQSRPIVGMAALTTANGYWLTNDNGAVTNFGTAVYWGSAPQVLNRPVVGIAAAVGNGDPGSTSFQSGSYGYDVSNYQCNEALPPTHAVALVQVEGWAFGSVNACLSSEVTWAAGGLNLYTFLSFGTSQTPEPGCGTTPTPDACNFGYAAALNSYDSAKAVISTRATVPWWLDVEPANWSSSTASNRSVVQGAYDALHYASEINTVGFYFSAALWTTLVGSYVPDGPLWVAWYTGTPQSNCTTVRSTFQIPVGALELTQYSDQLSYDGNNFDGDYAC